MNNLQIPLNSFVNTNDENIIKRLDTQEKDVLDKKNTLVYKSVLSPMYTKAENKVYTTSGHTISKTSNEVLTDENGRTYAVDNTWIIQSTTDISQLWSGELTSAIYKDGLIYSIWKSERDYTIVVSDVDNNILGTKNYTVDTTDLLYYNVKLANYTRLSSEDNQNLYYVVQKVYSTPKTTIEEYNVVSSSTGHITRVPVRTTDYNYLTGKDLYVLRAMNSGVNKLFIGTDDTDLRKRFTFYAGAVVYKYWGCLGANGLLTGEPVLTTVNSRGTGLLSTKTLTQDDFSYLANGIGYGQQLTAGTDAEDISSNSSLGTGTISANEATAWGGYTRTRTGTKAIVCGIDLENNIPLVLSANYKNVRAWSGNCKTEIVSLDEAYFTAETVSGTHVVTEQVDFSDAWGNHTWTTGTADITNGCNPFPYKYMIMNRAESKGRYWDYGPGWARCYFRQGIIKQKYNSANYYRAFAEEYPTSIISFGLSSINGKNAVRQEYLDPICLRANLGTGTTYDAYKTAGWLNDNQSQSRYYRYHNISDNNSHIWTNFVGADNLGDHTILDKLPFNVDIVPELNLKDQYFALQYMSTSMQGTLLTSASIQQSTNSMIFIKDVDNAALFSNGLVLVGKRNGDIKLEKIADYIYRTNTLTGNNLFIDSKETFYGQRGFIPFNGEELITLDSISSFYSSIDDENTDGNDNYFTGSGYNINMTDMQKRGISYILPAATIPLIVDSNQTEDFTFQLASNKKEITKPLLYNQFTYKDDAVDHFYTQSLDTTSIKYQVGKKMETTSVGDIAIYGIATYDVDKEGFVWYVTSDVYFYPMGIASPVKGINYLSSTVDMTDNYTVRLYRTQNVTFPVYNPTTEVYKGSTIFTIYGYNYSFDGQSIYYLGSGDATGENSFACYALGMQFLANSGTEAYFYSPFEKRIYLFTGSNTLQIADSLSRMGDIIDSIYSSCEQILYLMDSNGNIIAKSQNDMCVLEGQDTSYHFEGTDSGMVLAKGFNYKKFRLYKTDEEEWLPFTYETEFLGDNDKLFRVSNVDITFYKGGDDTVKGNLKFTMVFDKTPPKEEVQDFKITKVDWEPTHLKKVRFVPKNGQSVKAFKFGLESDDYIYVANVCINVEEISSNTNAPIHR